MPSPGDTTVPSELEEPTSEPGASLRPAFFIAHSTQQPERIAEVAVFDSRKPAPAIMGREAPGGPERTHFHIIRPGETIDGGPLTGNNVSHDQLEIRVALDALRVKRTGKAPVLVDGTEVPRGATVLVPPGSVLEIAGNCVLLAGRSPLSMPPPSARLLPLPFFGRADRMGFIGESLLMWQLREAILLAAASGRHVFVGGETGTGKELVARAIHMESARSKGPLVEVNSACLTVELAAYDLFGARKGYADSGLHEHPGYFGAAKGGTLLLDELGEVLDAVQAPLLRALEGFYHRKGDTAPRATECVVVIATNRGPDSIKHDVLHRLGVPIETPSLAARREDIPLLVRAAVPESIAIHPSLIVNLLRTAFPGNVRQLNNFLANLVDAHTGDGPLRWPSRVPKPEPLPLALISEGEAPTAASRETKAKESPAPRRGADDPGKEGLRQALERNHWHYGRTALALKISEDRLYRLRVKYGLHRPE